MIFRKKRPMIDIRELQKQGRMLKDPDQKPPKETNGGGFLDLHASKSDSSASKESSSAVDFFAFNNSTESSAASSDSFSTQTDGYDKREVDEKITGLDNKIYKLEQRLELLERKLDVNQGQTSSSSTSAVGPMGW